jgi:hypothetical protein
MRLSDRRLIALLAALAAALAVAASAAANADPASDYLITLPLFVPFENEVSDDKEAELTELLNSAKDKGYEVRVALISARGDLGGVPVLFNKPQRYADFLGQEITYFYRGPVLVVMPNGYGVFQSGKPLKEDKLKLAQLAPVGSTNGDALAGGAENAVRSLAQRRGITLPRPEVESGSASRSGDRMQIIAGVLILGGVALATRFLLARRGGGSDQAA